MFDGIPSAPDTRFRKRRASPLDACCNTHTSRRENQRMRHGIWRQQTRSRKPTSEAVEWRECSACTRRSSARSMFFSVRATCEDRNVVSHRLSVRLQQVSIRIWTGGEGGARWDTEPHLTISQRSRSQTPLALPSPTATEEPAAAEATPAPAPAPEAKAAAAGRARVTGAVIFAAGSVKS
jgi:hypothetical protein